MTCLYVQHVTDPPDSQKNYLVVDSKTETSTIEESFEQFTRERKDIAIVLINQHVRANIPNVTVGGMERLTMRRADRRQDSREGRHVQRGIPELAGDPEQRSSV